MNYVLDNTFRFHSAIQILPSDIGEYFTSFVTAVAVVAFISNFNIVIEKYIFLTLQILLSERKFTYFTYLLQPTYKEEIDNIISSLNSSKASGPIGIPIRILFLLKNKISNQLADLFNFSFMTGVFPCVLKTATVVLEMKCQSNCQI